MLPDHLPRGVSGPAIVRLRLGRGCSGKLSGKSKPAEGGGASENAFCGLQTPLMLPCILIQDGLLSRPFIR
jgi:hypothetical protein